MRKKDLLNIPLPDAPEELISIAQNDEYITREFNRWGHAYEEKSYGTHLYFGAGVEEGILIIQIWGRAELKKGNYEPISVTYIDVDAEKWISRKEGKWTEALLENIYVEYKYQPKTSWMAKDVSTKGDTDLCNRLLGTEKNSVDDAVCAWQDRIREKANKKRAVRRKADWDRMMNLLPEIPEDFTEWAEGEGTIDDNFLFFKRNGKKSEVYCTNCGATFETTEKMLHNAGDKTHWNYRHEHQGFCSNCRQVFDTKSWRKQKALQTDSWVVLPQVAGEYVSMRMFKVSKVFKKKQILPGAPEIWEKKTFIWETSRVFADPKTFESTDSFRKEIVPSISKTCPCWKRVRQTTYSGKQYPEQISTGTMYMRNADEICAASGMRKFLYERCKGNQKTSPQGMLINIASRKYLEYLFRAGLNRLAEEVVNYRYGVKLNEDANNLKDLLGIDGQKLRIMKDIDGHLEMINTLNEIESRGEKVDIETLRIMNEEKIWIKDLSTDKTGLTVQRAMNYFRKQQAKENGSLRSITEEYKDYLRIAEQLCCNPKDEIICRTPDLKQMHDRYAEQYNNNKDQIRENNANRSFVGIAVDYTKNAEHFKYEKEGLLIMVPGRASDIIQEGREQHHCVGANNRYMERMDKRESYILFLRKKEEPEKPYYTLEVRWDGHVKQSYAAYDRRPDGEKIDEWLRYFTRAIKKRTEREKKTEAGKETKRILVAAG